MGVEAAVGPHGELTRGSGLAHPTDRFPQEVSRAPSGVGPGLAQSTHQHVGCDGPSRPYLGQHRVKASLAGVVVVLRTLLGQPKGLAYGLVQVNGQGIMARSRTSCLGSGQQFPAHPIQLAHVAPPETPQEDSQRGHRLDHVSQDPPSLASTACRRRRCSRRQPMPTLPGSGIRLPRSYDLAHLPGQHGCPPARQSQVMTQRSADPYELILNRHRSSSFVITSSRAVDEWLSFCDDPILGNSALDRLANASYQIVIEGNIYRERLSPHRVPQGANGRNRPAKT